MRRSRFMVRPCLCFNVNSNMIFVFSLGISIAVIGTIGSSNSNRPPPLSSYIVDGNNLSTYEPKLLPGAQRHQQFFLSPLLPDNNHTLVVTSLRNNCDPFLLDYFIIKSSESTLTASPTATSHGHSPRLRTATLAGSITAAVTGTILVVTVIYFFLRRRKRAEGSNANMISTCMYFLVFFSYVISNRFSVVRDDIPQFSELPTNQIPSSTKGRILNAHSAHEDPPQYEPPSYDPGTSLDTGETSRSAVSPPQSIAKPSSTNQIGGDGST
jgi:hypothetical protein